MRNAFIFHLNRILRCLGKKCKIFFIQNPGVCRNIANQTTVDFLFAEKNFFVLFKCFHILIDTVIGKKGHTIFFQRFQYVCLKGFLICKKSDLCFCHYKIRKNHRTTVDISPTYI